LISQPAQRRVSGEKGIAHMVTSTDTFVQLMKRMASDLVQLHLSFRDPALKGLRSPAEWECYVDLAFALHHEIIGPLVDDLPIPYTVSAAVARELEAVEKVGSDHC
jgi:hypothetical protein